MDEQLAEAWARLMTLFMSRRDVLFAALSEMGLTPPHGHALMSLLHGGHTRMRELADLMACDASYITSVADRLEELGFAERRIAPDDRRVKELALTKRGETVARRLDAIFSQPPATMCNLSKADRAHLARIACLLADDSPTGNWIPPLKLR